MNPADYIEVLRQYQGIIGTLLGVVVTLVTTQLLRCMGTTRFAVAHWEMRLLQRNSTGGFAETDCVTNAERAEYRLAVDLFNGADVPKGLRDITIVFETSHFHHEDRPLDADTVALVAGAMRGRTASVVNLPPSEFVHVNLQGALVGDGLKAICEGSRVYFRALDQRGTEFRKRVAVLYRHPN